MNKLLFASILGLAVSGPLYAAEQGKTGSAAGAQAAEEGSGDAALIGAGAVVAGTVGALLNAAAGDDANPNSTTTASSTQ